MAAELAGARHCLQQGAGDPALGVVGENDPLALADDGPVIRCRVCQQSITTPEMRMEINGCHCHTMPNPLGLVFEIGCFQQAQGCQVQGGVIYEHSWFPPYGWQVGLCVGCLSHLGWYFQAADLPSFWGLILANLVE